ncbi:MAG: cupin domain-containing protein [Alphaproteobacteria bacterium]
MSQKHSAYNEGKIQYVYKMDALDTEPDNETSAKIQLKKRLSGKSSSFGGALFGEKVIVGYIHKAAGTGSKRHTHPNEQYNFVLQGTLQCDIDDQTVLCPAGHCVHIPAGTEHSCMATPEKDVIFFVAKDTRHGISGPAVDGIEDGPRIHPDAKPGQTELDEKPI